MIGGIVGKRSAIIPVRKASRLKRHVIMRPGVIGSNTTRKNATGMMTRIT